MSMFFRYGELRTVDTEVGHGAVAGQGSYSTDLESINTFKTSKAHL